MTVQERSLARCRKMMRWWKRSKAVQRFDKPSVYRSQNPSSIPPSKSTPSEPRLLRGKKAMLVLIIGDLHIPDRAGDLPAKFKRLLVPGKIQQIICTGNVCDKETYEYLRSIAPAVNVVRGDCDENVHYPLSLTIPCPPSLRIGVLGGQQVIPPGDHDALAGLARGMDVDVLVTGGTHKFESFESEGRFFINPGSASGAWSGLRPGEKTVPSFALMDIQGPQVVTYVYSLVEGEVKVEKVEYRKSIEEMTAGGGTINMSGLGIKSGGTW